MKTNLAEFIKNTPEGREADSILRACVHCGFCTATCPTYQLLGDELDGPRGRIYLIKEVLEGNACYRQDATAPGSLPHLSRLRDHLPLRGAVRPAGGHRPQHCRETRRPAFHRISQAHRAAYRDSKPGAVRPAVQGRPVPAAAVARRAQTQSAESRCAQYRLARAAQRAQDAGPRRMRATLAGARHQSGNGACAGPAGNFPGESRSGGLLRRRDLPSEPPGRRARLHAPEYRRVVAPHRSRCGSGGHDRERLRHHGEGVRTSPGPRSGLRGKGEADIGHDQGHQRSALRREREDSRRS